MNCVNGPTTAGAAGAGQLGERKRIWIQAGVRVRIEMKGCRGGDGIERRRTREVTRRVERRGAEGDERRWWKRRFQEYGI